MAYKLCERCGGSGRIGSGICAVCGGKGKTRQHFVCALCNGRFYVPRDPPLRVMCPHCNSLLLVEWALVTILERGTIPIPAPGSRPPLGVIGGGLLGLALGGPLGGLVGAILGGLAGAISESPIEAREG